MFDEANTRSRSERNGMPPADSRAVQEHQGHDETTPTTSMLDFLDVKELEALLSCRRSRYHIWTLTGQAGMMSN